MAKRQTLQNQPKESLEKIIYQLDIEDALNLCRTNKLVKEECESDYFWKKRLLNDFKEKYKINDYDYLLLTYFPQVKIRFFLYFFS